MDKEKIIKRLLHTLGAPKIIDILSNNISPTDLQFLLAEVFKNKIDKLNIQKLKEQYHQNRFVKSADITQKELLSFDYFILQLLPDYFSTIELSPLSPLGINSLLAKISSSNTLPTIRNTEINADPTTALALNCYQERKLLLQKDSANASTVNFATTHRSIRTQDFSKISGFTPHFRTFALGTAGRDIGSEKFESVNIINHINFYLDILLNIVPSLYEINSIEIQISNIRIIEKLIDKVKINRRNIGLNTQNNLFQVFNN